MTVDKFHLSMKNIEIEFPGIKALKGVDFNTEGGVIHALVGANGAGKSTLMSVLSGRYTHYTGEISINGQNVEIRSASDAKKLGLEIVYQEVDTALIPYLSVAENVMFNNMVNSMTGSVVSWSEIKRVAKEQLDKLNITLDLNAHVDTLTLAQKQMVLIARCLASNCRLLILDEPTAPLSNTETKELFRVVRDLSSKGLAIIFISHRLAELYEICSQITVMRDGANVCSYPLTREIEQNTIVEQMLGRSYSDAYQKMDIKLGKELLRVEHLSERENAVQDINLYVREGEIVGIAGLVGAGKTELCKTLFGAMQAREGTITLEGKKVDCSTPYHAVQNGFALVPEERRKEGVLITDSVYENISIAAIDSVCNAAKVVSVRKQKAVADKYIEDLGIKTPSNDKVVALLSGGNQQKVVLAKWLNSKAKVYIFDEPTKGIDVGAKQDMYVLIEKLAASGCGAIYATCEFNEILSICDRIYVMYDGQIVKELLPKETSEKELLFYCTGGR